MRYFIAALLIQVGFISAARADLEAMEKRVPEIVTLKDQGIVGEQPDGMLGLVKPDAASAKPLVDAENKDRLDEYKKRAAVQETPVETLMKVLGEARIRKEKEGRFIRGPEGDWAKKK